MYVSARLKERPEKYVGKDSISFAFKCDTDPRPLQLDALKGLKDSDFE